MTKIVNYYKDLSIQMKSTIWYIFCNVLQAGITFVFTPLYVRLLSTNEYGEFAVFYSWKDLLLIVVTLNLFAGVFTKLMIDHDDDRNRCLSSMQGLITILSLFWIIVYSLNRSFFNNVLDMDTSIVIMLSLYFVFYSSFQFWTIKQRVEYRYKRMVLLTLIIAVLTPTISILLLHLTDLRTKALIYGLFVSQILIGLILYIVQFARGKCFFDKKYWIYALKFNIPLIPHYLSLMILSQADRIMIDNICGPDKAAIYNLAYLVSSSINLIISAINAAFVPWIYEQLKNNNYIILKNRINKIIYFVMILTALIILVAPEIIGIIGTKEYYDAIYIIPPVCVGIYYSFCYGFYSSIEFYYSKTSYVMIASSIGAIVNIVLNGIFIPRYGYIAAGYTTLISYVVLLCMHYFFVRKIEKNMNIKGSFIDDRNILVVCVVLFLYIFICVILYQNLWVKTLVILLLILLIISNWKKIKNIFEDLV